MTTTDSEGARLRVTLGAVRDSIRCIQRECERGASKAVSIGRIKAIADEAMQAINECRGPADKKPFWLTCAECGHNRVAAYIPMEVKLFVKVTARSPCPACGGTKSLISNQEDGRLLPAAATERGQ
jgi:hypothetical protein